MLYSQAPPIFSSLPVLQQQKVRHDYTRWFSEQGREQLSNLCVLLADIMIMSPLLNNEQQLPFLTRTWQQTCQRSRWSTKL